MNWAMGNSVRLSMRTRRLALPHILFRMRRRTRISTSMPVPPTPMNSVGRTSMRVSCLGAAALVWVEVF
ncbi:hypothetical protein D3C79_1056030 [compost metagenome]